MAVMITGNTYYDKLPSEYSLVDSTVELYELIPKKQKMVLANLRFIDSPVVVFSGFSGRYYLRNLRDQKEDFIRAFVRKRMCYMPRERKCSTGERTRRECHLMLEYYMADKTLQGRETKIKMLKQKLKELKDGTSN